MLFQAGAASSPLGDLDDGTLLHCFAYLTPLPDLFNVAASCRRFRDLALDRRSWLYVTHAAAATTASSGGTLTSPQPPTLQLQRPQQPPVVRAASPLGGAARIADGTADDRAHWYRSQFATLEAAVAASRPGDTILLEAGPVAHMISAPVVVPHPLHILGGGGEAEECVLEGARGVEAIIDFRASGRLANLTLRATAGACVAHTRGRLTVQGCTLECDARGLPHLAAPLLTRAVSFPSARPPSTPAAAAAAARSGSKRPADAPPSSAAAVAIAAAGFRPPTAQPAAVVEYASRKRPAGWLASSADPAGADGAPASKRMRLWRSAAEAAAGPGVLSVLETRIKAQGSAVSLRGSGRLSGVRAIYSTGHALVWLEVDSANSSSSQLAPAIVAAEEPGVVDAAAAGAGISDGGSSAGVAPGGSGAGVAPGGSGTGGMLAAPVLPHTPLPSWAARGAGSGFDAAAFQRRAQQLGGSANTPSHTPQQQEQQAQDPVEGQTPHADASIAQKAEEWCLHHRSAAAVPEPEAVPPLPV